MIHNIYIYIYNYVSRGTVVEVGKEIGVISQ